MEFPSQSKPQLVYFYDNDKDSFKSKHICQYIVPKKVLDHGYKYNKMPNKMERQEYLQLIQCGEDPNHVFAELMFSYKFYPDLQSGISRKQMERLRKVVAKKKKNLTKVVFDFDRTLTKIEGFPKPWIEQKSFNDILKSMHKYVGRKNKRYITQNVIQNYFLGGVKRANELKSLISFLKQNSIEVWLLTNNKGLMENPASFAMILHGLGLQIDAEKMLYNHKKDKYKTLCSHKDFKEIVHQAEEVKGKQAKEEAKYEEFKQEETHKQKEAHRQKKQRKDHR